MCTQAKIVPQKKTAGPMPLGYIFKEDFYAPSSPEHYSGAGSASLNRSEVRLKIVFFLKDHNITSISTVCLGLGKDLFLFCLEITEITVV